ncbi:MAG: hypothetical protein RL095_237 [Verrucomicrobiota bacterium]|jgi:RHS repeat-associated protein
MKSKLKILLTTLLCVGAIWAFGNFGTGLLAPVTSVNSSPTSLDAASPDPSIGNRGDNSTTTNPVDVTLDVDPHYCIGEQAIVRATLRGATTGSWSWDDPSGQLSPVPSEPDTNTTSARYFTATQEGATTISATAVTAQMARTSPVTVGSLSVEGPSSYLLCSNAGEQVIKVQSCDPISIVTIRKLINPVTTPQIIDLGGGNYEIHFTPTTTGGNLLFDITNGKQAKRVEVSVTSLAAINIESLSKNQIRCTAAFSPLPILAGTLSWSISGAGLSPSNHSRSGEGTSTVWTFTDAKPGDSVTISVAATCGNLSQTYVFPRDVEPPSLCVPGSNLFATLGNSELSIGEGTPLRAFWSGENGMEQISDVEWSVIQGQASIVIGSEPSTWVIKPLSFGDVVVQAKSRGQSAAACIVCQGSISLQIPDRITNCVPVQLKAQVPDSKGRIVDMVDAQWQILNGTATLTPQSDGSVVLSAATPGELLLQVANSTGQKIFPVSVEVCPPATDLIITSSLHDEQLTPYYTLKAWRDDAPIADVTWKIVSGEAEIIGTGAEIEVRSNGKQGIVVCEASSQGIRQNVPLVFANPEIIEDPTSGLALTVNRRSVELGGSFSLKTFKKSDEGVYTPLQVAWGFEPADADSPLMTENAQAEIEIRDGGTLMSASSVSLQSKDLTQGESCVIAVELDGVRLRLPLSIIAQRSSDLIVNAGLEQIRVGQPVQLNAQLLTYRDDPSTGRRLSTYSDTIAQWDLVQGAGELIHREDGKLVFIPSAAGSVTLNASAQEMSRQITFTAQAATGKLTIVHSALKSISEDVITLYPAQPTADGSSLEAYLKAVTWSVVSGQAEIIPNENGIAQIKASAPGIVTISAQSENDGVATQELEFTDSGLQTGDLILRCPQRVGVLGDRLAVEAWIKLADGNLALAQNATWSCLPGTPDAHLVALAPSGSRTEVVAMNAGLGLIQANVDGHVASLSLAFNESSWVISLGSMNLGQVGKIYSYYRTPDGKLLPQACSWSVEGSNTPNSAVLSVTPSAATFTVTATLPDGATRVLSCSTGTVSSGLLINSDPNAWLLGSPIPLNAWMKQADGELIAVPNPIWSLVSGNAELSSLPDGSAILNNALAGDLVVNLQSGTLSASLSIHVREVYESSSGYDVSSFIPSSMPCYCLALDQSKPRMSVTEIRAATSTASTDRSISVPLANTYSVFIDPDPGNVEVTWSVKSTHGANATINPTKTLGKGPVTVKVTGSGYVIIQARFYFKGSYITAEYTLHGPPAAPLTLSPATKMVMPGDVVHMSLTRGTSYVSGTWSVTGLGSSLNLTQGSANSVTIGTNASPGSQIKVKAVVGTEEAYGIYTVIRMNPAKLELSVIGSASVVIDEPITVKVMYTPSYPEGSSPLPSQDVTNMVDWSPVPDPLQVTGNQVRSRKLGRFSLQASYYGLTDRETVEFIHDKWLWIEPKPFSAYTTQTIAVSAILYSKNFAKTPLSANSVTWSINSREASITTDGVVSTSREGRYTVTGTYTFYVGDYPVELTATCYVHFTKPPITYVLKTDKVEDDFCGQIKAYVIDSEGRTISARFIIESGNATFWGSTETSGPSATIYPQNVNNKFVPGQAVIRAEVSPTSSSSSLIFRTTVSFKDTPLYLSCEKKELLPGEIVKVRAWRNGLPANVHWTLEGNGTSASRNSSEIEITANNYNAINNDISIKALHTSPYPSRVCASGSLTLKVKDSSPTFDCYGWKLGPNGPLHAQCNTYQADAKGSITIDNGISQMPAGFSVTAAIKSFTKDGKGILDRPTVTSNPNDVTVKAGSAPGDLVITLTLKFAGNFKCEQDLNIKVLDPCSCSCIDAPAGTAKAEMHSLFAEIPLGTSADGWLQISAETAAELTGTAADLKLSSVPTSTNTVYLTGTRIPRQIRTSTRLYDIIESSAGTVKYFTVNIYTKYAGAPDAAGIYPVEGLNTAGHVIFKRLTANDFLLVSKVEGESDPHHTRWINSSGKNWEIHEECDSNGNNPLFRRAKTATAKDAQGNYTESLIAYSGNVAQPAVHLNWQREGDVDLLKSIYDQQRITTFQYVHRYYPAKQRLERVTLPDGMWRSFSYDTEGRVEREMFPSAFGTVSKTFTYSTNTSITPILRNPPAETKVFINDKLISRSTMVFTAPTEYVRSDYYGSSLSSKLTTYVALEGGNGKHRFQPKKILRPDGTMSIFKWSQTAELEGSSRSVARHGTPDNIDPNSAANTFKNSTIVTTGFEEITESGAGQPKLHSIQDIATKIFLTDVRYDSSDVYKRPTTIRDAVTGETSTITYNRYGPVSITDPRGLETIIERDGLGRVTKEFTAGVGGIKRTLDGLGRATSLSRIGSDSDSSEQVIASMSYDKFGQLSGGTDALGGATSLTYSVDLLSSTLTQPDGSTFTQTRALSGEPLSISGTAVDSASVTYTLDGITRRIKRTIGKVSSYEDIDALGRTIRKINSIGGETLYTYNAKGQLATVKTPDLVTTTYTYNTLGEIISSVSTGRDPVTYARSFEVKDGKNCLKSVTSTGTTSSGIITSTTWNSTDGLKSWSAVTADGKTLRSSSETVWNGSQSTSTSIAADDSRTIVTSNKGRISSVETRNPPPRDANGSIEKDEEGNELMGVQLSSASYSYDKFGRIDAVSDSRSGESGLVYNALDQVTSATGVDPDGSGPLLPQTTGYEYDNMGRLTKTTLPLSGNEISYSYSLKGELLSVSGSQAYPQTYGYDLGRIKTLSTQGIAGDATTTWNYDQFTGLLMNKVYPNNGKISYAFDKAARLISRTNARGQKVLFGYNSAGDLDEINYPDTTDVALTYSTKGLINKISDDRGAETITRNGFGLITGMNLQDPSGTVELDNLSHIYTYDDLMRRTSSAWNINQGTGKIFGATTSYTYDTASRLKTVSSEGLSFNYDYVVGSPDTVKGYKAFNGPVPSNPELEPGLVSVSRTQDLMGRLTKLERISNDSAGNEKTRAVHELTHNALNQRVSVKRPDGSVWTYEYDNKGQLTKASLKASELAGATTLSSFDAAYDDIGNRLTSEFKKDENASTETKTYTSNQLNQLTGLTVNGTASILTYDADGNLTGDATWTYKFDSADRLIEMVKRDTTQKLKFFYDYAGRRYRKQVFEPANTSTADVDTLFVYEGWNLVAELDNKTNGLSFIRSYTWGLDLSGSLQGAGGVGGLLAFKDGSGNHLTLADERGNVDRVINPSTGLVENSYEYGSFGELLSSVEAAPLPLRFSTKYLDAETSLYYYGFRYYDAANGRWINRDPIEEEGGLNIYGFVGNEPGNYVDRNGLDEVKTDPDTKGVVYEVSKFPYNHQVYAGQEIDVNGTKIIKTRINRKWVYLSYAALEKTASSFNIAYSIKDSNGMDKYTKEQCFDPSTISTEDSKDWQNSYEFYQWQAKQENKGLLTDFVSEMSTTALEAALVGGVAAKAGGKVLDKVKDLLKKRRGKRIEDLRIPYRDKNGKPNGKFEGGTEAETAYDAERQHKLDLTPGGGQAKPDYYINSGINKGKTVDVKYSMKACGDSALYNREFREQIEGSGLEISEYFYDQMTNPKNKRFQKHDFYILESRYFDEDLREGLIRAYENLSVSDKNKFILVQ